ncbi:hypothetical protein FB451DRAFT_1391621 [Mycena latifolia]|nr:hypothetical protein FB451DRAFT_1391621 [Mycena latifolia]
MYLSAILRCFMYSLLLVLLSLPSRLLNISNVLQSLLTLKNERRVRSNYVTTLKGVLSPARRIPPEILTEILLFCRDRSLQNLTYSVLDPRQGSMLLSHVSSRWQQVCHSSPRLWDRIHLPGHSSDLAVLLLQPILARSNSLPLYVDLGMRDHNVPNKLARGSGPSGLQAPPSTETHSSIHLVLRLQTGHCQRRTSLPLLSSMKLIMRMHVDVDIAPVLTLLKNAPQLRNLHLEADCVLEDSLASRPRLPWSQLIQLILQIPLTFTDARNILAQCETMHECQLNVLLGLHIHYYEIENALFKELTNSGYLDGAVVADVAESLRQHTGAANTTFPALGEVHLWLDDPSFDDETETRLAAACSTWHVKDHCTRRENSESDDSDETG